MTLSDRAAAHARPVPSRRRRTTVAARAVATLLGLALVVAACGGDATPSAPTPDPSSPGASAAPSPAPSGSTDVSGIEALAGEIAEQVATIRELELKEPLDVEVLDEPALIAFVERQFTEENPTDYVAAYDRLLTRLGLFPADADLAETYVELLGSQVLGLYDEETDTLYVVAREGGLGATEKVTLAHEIGHALQDQHFDLGTVVPEGRDQGDAVLGALSLVEGDATLAMTLWATTNLTPQEALELVEDAQDPEQAAILERTPPILREGLVFPYEAGLTLALGLRSEGGWAGVDAAFDRPPASTEQVIHPEKYDANEAPVPVDLPSDLAARMGPGWSLDLEDTFGELQLRIWLQTAGDREPDDSEGATAEGWGGDRLGYLAGPDGAEAVVMRTVWDDAASADRFQEAAARVVADVLPDPGTLFRLSGREVLVIAASDGAVLDAAVAAFDLPR